MDEVVDTLRYDFRGYGHWKITITLDGVDYSTITTNSMGIDTAFDYEYDDNVDEGRYYESQREAQLDLIDEIVRKNDDKLYFENNELKYY